MSTDLKQVLEFLAFLHKEGKAYSTINVHRSALSMTLGLHNDLKLGVHPLVKRLMKACYVANPPQPRYSHTWDPDLVLRFMASDTSDSWLGPKLATLLALSAYLRVSDLAYIDRSSIFFDEHSVSFSLLKVRKSQKQGALRSFRIPRNDAKAICPVDCMGLYTIQTDPVRSCEYLFLSKSSPHSKASASTIGRWVKGYLSKAGIPTEIFSAHSTRSAAASKAFALGVPLDSILKAADWSSQTTFTRFYHRKTRT